MLCAVPPERIPQGHGQADRLVLRAVPILPPDSWPLVLLDSGNGATADVNDLYRQLINRGNRLSKLEELHAPLPLICNERASCSAARMDCRPTASWRAARQSVMTPVADFVIA